MVCIEKGFGVFKSGSPQLNLVGLNELQTMDRWSLESRSRALAQTAFLGQQLTLCRIMGRYKIYVTTTDIGFGAHVMMDGIWESWLTIFMAKRIKSGMHVVDAGANHGYYTVLFADLVGKGGRVAAVEPNPKTAQLLRWSIAVNGFSNRVEVFENALGAADGEMLNFHTPIDEPKNARVVSAELSGHPNVISVTGAKLDTLLAEGPKVDFMKIDVEGAEEGMLAGAWTIIERDRPDILLEFSSVRCSDPAGVLDRLEAIYGAFNEVDFNSQTKSVGRAALLDASNQEDFLLFLSVR